MLDWQFSNSEKEYEVDGHDLRVGEKHPSVCENSSGDFG